MELDEFKQRLKEQVHGETLSRTAHELGSYTGRRTASVLKKIKRSIVFELLACVIFIAAAVWAWMVYSFPYVHVFCLLCFFMCCFLLLYLGAFYKKISACEKQAAAVRENLRQVIGIIEQFTRLYFQFTMITLPIAFIFGLITGFFSLANTVDQKNFNWQRSVFFYSCWFVFWSVIMYFFSKWYIKKLYGNYLHQLKEQLRDIENG